jgi:hypothetical protein
MSAFMPGTGTFGRESFNGPLFAEEGLGRFNFSVSKQEGDL